MPRGGPPVTGSADPTPPASGEAQPRWRWLGPVVALIVLGFALWSLHNELRGLTWLEVRSDLSALPTRWLVLGLLLTALNYLVLTQYDALALRYAGIALSRGRTALAATIGYALSQGLGFPLLTGAPVRFRLYSSWGVGALDIGRIVAFYTSSFWVGFAGIASVAFMVWPVRPPTFVSLPGDSLRILGGLLLVGVLVVLGWALRGKGRITLGPLQLPVPRAGLVVSQVLLGAVDWTVAASVLWVMLPEGHALGFGPFLSTYLLAQSAGVVSHLPGGLGVFEAVLLSFLPDGPGNSQVLASLLAFRLVYYLVPLFMAVLLLGLRELRERKEAIGPPTLRAARAVSQVVPGASAALVFALGGVLLLSGSVPVPRGRLELLTDLLPLRVLELSHFLASILGAGLLLLARGLQRRLDGAYHLALFALLLSALLMATRDLHAVASVTYLVGATILYVSRKEFYRRASLLDEPFTPAWVLAIAAMLVTTVWLGFFAFEHVEYSNDLWWRFTFEDDAPRFLRALVGVAVTISLFLAARLLRPAPVGGGVAGPDVLARLAPVAEAAPNTEANLVFLGDKDVVLSESGRSFIMYAVSGSSWVVMGDPVGEPSEFEELAWNLRDRADRAGGHLVFYEVGPTWLPLYIDLGLVFYKLGEDARVPLEGFTLEGRERAELRQSKRRLEREGGVFEVVPKEAVAPLLPRLREISDEWLKSKSVREKRFSLGCFHEEYLQHFPCAVVRVDGTIHAFANLWTSTSREELTVDLMRYSDSAPKGVMTALFTHLLIWGGEQGYRWFSLGMAPFAGMETHRLAPAWQRMGAALFRYGEHFYNFQGLHDYKEKFSPVWEPRYLAAPPGLGLPKILTDATALISGGLRGAVMR
ncbi:MAG: bifunctional lysylphosphatidylglycerol flippase/synthetase MprF [Gemmatimonadota bacterium]